ncbi:MAG: GxxExxY protein [Deltaproteobacteria bacterium]|nr:GxxExxY protein [Deltaproteobacteria bacterium]
MIENDIGRIIVDASIKVHRALGPGLFESVYEKVLSYELSLRQLHLERQVDIPIEYDGLRFDGGFRADIIVEKTVILELKSVESILPVHKKQIQTYLKLTGCKLGFLLNFNANLMKDGIIRCVNNLAE